MLPDDNFNWHLDSYLFRCVRRQKAGTRIDSENGLPRYAVRQSQNGWSCYEHGQPVKQDAGHQEVIDFLGLT